MKQLIEAKLTPYEERKRGMLAGGNTDYTMPKVLTAVGLRMTASLFAQIGKVEYEPERKSQ